MMKRTILLLLGLLTGIHAIAQSNIRMSHYLSDAGIINPAAIDHALPRLKLSLSTRGQWIQFPGAPVTGWLSGVYYNESMQSQFGIHLTADKIGYTSTTNLALAYTYAVHMNNIRLSMGLSAHTQDIFYNTSQILFETAPIDPAQHALRRQQQFNAGFGLEMFVDRYTSGNWTFGWAAQNLGALFRKGLEPFANTNLVYGKYRTGNRTNWYHSPHRQWWDFSVAATGIHTRAHDNPNVFQGEFNANFHLNYKRTHIFTFGLLYRTRQEAGLIVGIDWINQFALSCIYEYPLQYAKPGTVNPYGTVELLLTYRWQSQQRDVPCGKINGKPCPEIDVLRPSTKCIDCQDFQNQ